MRGARSVRPRWSEQEFVDINPRYYRPTEIDVLLGDSSKATRLLGGRPSTSFAELVKLMMDADLELADRELRVGAGPGRH